MRNGSSIIDLSPLIHQTGGYEAYDESEDESSDTNPDYYINICQPLNPMHGLACPAGAAVCKVPVDGPPIVSAGNPRGSQLRGVGAHACACAACFPWGAPTPGRRRGDPPDRVRGAWGGAAWALGQATADQRGQVSELCREV